MSKWGVPLILLAWFLVAPVPGFGAEAPATDVLHEVQAGDNLHLIAGYYYGDARQWERVWAANRDQVRNPNRLTNGIWLRVPEAVVPAEPYADFLARSRPVAKAAPAAAAPAEAGAPASATPAVEGKPEAPAAAVPAAAGKPTGLPPAAPLKAAAPRQAAPTPLPVEAPAKATAPAKPAPAAPAKAGGAASSS
jgi:hypothetical protein